LSVVSQSMPIEVHWEQTQLAKKVQGKLLVGATRLNNSREAR